MIILWVRSLLPLTPEFTPSDYVLLIQRDKLCVWKVSEREKNNVNGLKGMGKDTYIHI